MTELPRLVERRVDADGKRRIAFLRGPYLFEFEVGEDTFTAIGDSGGLGGSLATSFRTSVRDAPSLPSSRP